MKIIFTENKSLGLGYDCYYSRGNTEYTHLNGNILQGRKSVAMEIDSPSASQPNELSMSIVKCSEE